MDTTKGGSVKRPTAMAVAVLVILAGVVNASAAKAPDRVTSVLLPARYSFYSISREGGAIELTGVDVPSSNNNPSTSAKCVTARVDPATLRLEHVVVGSCAQPYRFWVAVSHPFSNNTTARIAHRESHTGRVVVGRVVMTWSDASNTHLQWIVGDGSLWLFDAATKKGAEVVRVSEATGKVGDTIVIPGGLDRPILATDDDGLWMGVATNGGYAYRLPGSPIYHIAVGSDRAKIVFVEGHATFWMMASGHTLWDDIAVVAPHGAYVTQTLWRFNGPQARRIFHVRSHLPYGVQVIGNETEGLWTVASQLPPGSPRTANTDTDCTGTPAVVGVNPSTGAERVVATLPVWAVGVGFECDAEDLSQQQAIIEGHCMLLLDGRDGGTGYTALFRVKL